MKPDDPSCREARSTIALVAAILVTAHYKREDAIVEAQAIYDNVVRKVVKRHGGGKGKGSYPVSKR